MPPRRSSATARAAAAVTAAPMTAAAVEQLIKARVFAALANHERETLYALGGVRTRIFLNCKPLSFKGTEGVVVLSQWFEKMESVFHISNCAVENQVKFATCTFLGNCSDMVELPSLKGYTIRMLLICYGLEGIKKMMTSNTAQGVILEVGN
ncbi:hypothetical protein Tco_0308736 [Tanacetum coccineum]